MWISELRYMDPRTDAYMGSPSLVRLPDGAIIASHDYFGKGCPRNLEGEEHLTSIYRSEDDGLTWKNLTHISGAYWSSLFVHDDALYLLGTSAQYGSIVIRRSENGGYRWTFPADAGSGLIDKGGVYHDNPNYHCAPVPLLHAQGRIWRAFEDCHDAVWGSGFRALVISAPEDSDLLNAANWTMTNKLVYDQDTDPPEFAGGGNGAGWLEGNVVEGPDGQLWDILRCASVPVLNKGAMVKITDPETLELDPATSFIDMPGGLSKFSIRRDPVDGVYWTLTNDMQDEPYPVRRNRLSIFSSTDLKNWTRRRVLLEDNMECDPEASVTNTGFQYVDWQFDGDNIIYLVRTGYDGAHNMHDANRMTFSRIRNYRLLLGQER